MAESNVQVNNAPTAGESLDKAKNQSESLLAEILDTMHNSDAFPRTGKDAHSRFWSAYERMAKQHDDEFLERHNGDMDVLLIFAGLFSAVSSSFIVNMNSSLGPNASDTTNALLKILINKVDNGTFSAQDATLPVWKGPSSTIIWIQTLAYASLSTSLFAAFGAVLGKQWLGHFKTSRFGRGALHERCKRRQQKLDGLEAWHFSTIMATLPIFLQLSLLFFGIALSANIWIQQHTIASVIMATTAFGVMFYFFTVLASLKSPDCPFQTPISTVIEHAIRHAISFRRMVRKTGEERPNSWAGFLDRLLLYLADTSKSAKVTVTGYVRRALVYLSQIPSTLWRRARLLVDDPESGRGSEQAAFVESLDLEFPDLPAEPTEPRAIQWIIETSTDTDIISAAVTMVPEVEWPDNYDVTAVSDRLKGTFYACLDPTWQVTLQTQKQAAACLKAMCHVERATGPLIRFRYHGIYLDGDTYDMPRDQGFLLVSYALDEPNELDIFSLSLSDRMWLARMFTYRLHEGDGDLRFLNFLTEFIDKCLYDRKSHAPRLVADCLLLSALMIGLRVDRRQLARLDKSIAITPLHDSVITHMLDLLLGEFSSVPQDFSWNARKLLQPLAHPHENSRQRHHDVSMRWLELCFRFLEDEHPGTEGSDVQFKDIAAILRHSLLSSPVRGIYLTWLFMHEIGPSKEMYWMGRPEWHTPAQFDLLAHYLIRVCEGTDYDAIGDTFVVLAGLRGSPSTPERKRLYIETATRCMGQDIPIRARHAALGAASAVRVEIASLGREDESFRELFSQALTSAVSARDPATQQTTGMPLDDKPFHEHSLYTLRRSLSYLELLCTLAQEPSWHRELDRNGHIKSCLAIADTLPSWTNDFNLYGVHIAHIFAVVDGLGVYEDHQFLSVIQAYPSWPLILRSWTYLFEFSFFTEAADEGWQELFSKGYVDALSSVVAYARRHWKEWDNRPETDRLLQLVAQICGKLDEEKQRREQLGYSHGDDSSENQEIPDLGKQIRALLWTFEST